VNPTSLKARIRNKAKEKKIPAQMVLQTYMFEGLLERLSRSGYRDKFILKGGLLIAAMVGLENRATMDMDTTIQSYPLDEAHVRTAIREICTVPVDDGITFTLTNVLPIRNDDPYGGFRASLSAVFQTIKTPLTIDLTSGDIITPKPVLRRFRSLFDEAKRTELWAYNIETVLAEKAEAILSLGIFNTRPRDFYDIYILVKTQKYNRSVFQKALFATANHRHTSENLKDAAQSLDMILKDTTMQSHWEKYRREYNYADKVNFEDVIQVLKELLGSVKIISF
jgi:predicted nucleotidyltransferase component of viral defense system